MFRSIPSTDGEIRGEYVTLEPLQRTQIGELFPVLSHKLVFASGFGGGLEAYTTDPEEFVAWADRFFPFDEGKTFAVRIASGPDQGSAVGTVSIMRFTQGREKVFELGWSGFDPRVWGTAVNAETKLLILTQLFSQDCEWVRVHTDDFNIRKGLLGEEQDCGSASRNETGEIFRLNAQNSEPCADFYDIHRSEWPKVRHALIARVQRQGWLPIRLDELD